MLLRAMFTKRHLRWFEKENVLQAATPPHGKTRQCLCKGVLVTEELVEPGSCWRILAPTMTSARCFLR